MEIHVRFESNGGSYVPVLSNSTVAKGDLVSQNAGSSNGDIYYKVGGGGLNGFFRDALGTDQTKAVNDALEAAYEAKFGAGAWKRDQTRRAADPPLTSFLVPVDAASCAKAGNQIVGMIYSVGPKLTSVGITDEKQYRGIYTDAFAAAVNANAHGKRIAAVRITMVSTGLYASGGDQTALYDTSARLILDGIQEAASAAAEAHFPGTVLVNNEAKSDGANKEVDSFTHAAKARGVPVDRAGFDLTVKTLR